MFVMFLLAFFMAISPASADAFWQKVSWNTPDGVILVGEYHPASQPGANTWVLLHGLGSSKDEWKNFARKLGEQGEGALLYDARGHFESVHTTDGKTLDYKDWRTAGPGSGWSMMVGDLWTAVDMLERRYKLSENVIAVGGASLGANVALVYASGHPKVPALLLLSAGEEYAGVNIVHEWQDLPHFPIFAAASPGDTYAYQSLRALVQQYPKPNLRVAEGPDGQHGVNMFKDPEFTQKLLDWMKSLDGNRDRRPS